MANVHYINEESDPAESHAELQKDQIRNLDAEDLLTVVSQTEKKWGLSYLGDKSTPLMIGFKLYYGADQLDENFLPRDPDLEHVADLHRSKENRMSDIIHRARLLEIYDTDSVDVNGNEFKVSARINRLVDTIDDAYEVVFRYGRQYDRINHPTFAPPNPEADNYSIFRATTMNIDDISPYQTLLLSLLDETYKHDIRRYKGQCCKQIETADKHRTRAWKPFSDIPSFVYGLAQKETRFEVWKNLTSKGNCARDVIKHLADCKDNQFPEIHKNRNVWSFNNGLLIGKEWSPKEGKYQCKFHTYESDEFRCLDPLIMSAKYFDKHFPNLDHIANWWDIPTPHFQSILDYQEFDSDVSKWMYVMGGRLCFDIGDVDSWQVIPFLKGIARSGKSTIITKVFKKFYENDDVRTLSNNIERKFGLSSIYDGFMFIAPEVKGDLALEQAEFQSLVSGEDVSIAVKHEKAKSIEWKTPGCLGGNEIPSWKDNSGSVLRRILPFNFSMQVEKADPHLDEKLDKELPFIMAKCISAYLEYAQRYSDQDIWNVVPDYFKKIQMQVAMVTNSLQNFLASEKIEYGADMCVPQKVFVQAFNTHCQENNLGRFKFNQDFYAGPFSNRKLKVKNEARTYKGRAYPVQPFIYGVDVVLDALQASSDF